MPLDARALESIHRLADALGGQPGRAMYGFASAAMLARAAFLASPEVDLVESSARCSRCRCNHHPDPLCEVLSVPRPALFRRLPSGELRVAVPKRCGEGATELAQSLKPPTSAMDDQARSRSQCFAPADSAASLPLGEGTRRQTKPIAAGIVWKRGCPTIRLSPRTGMAASDRATCSGMSSRACCVDA